MIELSTRLTQVRSARAAAARWAASVSVGYAVLLVVLRVLLAAQTDLPMFTAKFEFELVVVVLTGVPLWPAFNALARRPGFREGAGAHLGFALLCLFAAAAAAFAITAREPLAQSLVAHLVCAAPALGAHP